MSLKSWILAKSLVMILKAVNRLEKIKLVARQMDSIIDDTFKKESEWVQENIVIHVLLPLAKELMIEDQDRFKASIGEFLRNIKEEKNK
jgi:hypothetical protein